MSWFADFFWSDNYYIGAITILVLSGIIFFPTLCGSVFSDSKNDRKDLGRTAWTVLIAGPTLALIWHLIVPLALAIAVLVMLVIAFRNAKFSELFKRKSDVDEMEGEYV